MVRARPRRVLLTEPDGAAAGQAAVDPCALAAWAEAFREIVERGPRPGLLAFDGDTAVGWCQLTPRDDLAWLERTPRLERVDDVPVWSLSCFHVRPGHRRHGIATAPITAALKAANPAKAPALEAYPYASEL